MGPTRDNLIKRGLCYSPRWGQIAFTVPVFDEFVRRALSRGPDLSRALYGSMPGR